MLISVKQVLPTVLNPSLDWRLYLLHHWQSMVGTLKTRIRLEKIHNDTLIIGVYESHWMQELFLLSRVILHSINKHLGQQRILHLRFKLIEEKKSFSVVTKPIISAIEPAKVLLTHDQKNALMAVQDEQLRNELIRFLGRCCSRK